jgi:WD40 repeat protein/DNA-directed RNA polymerase subunit RPC12/RpoP
MAVIVVCPECDRRLKIAETKVGKSIRCPECDAMFKARPAASSSTKAEPPRRVPDDDEHGKGIPWLIILGGSGALIAAVAIGVIAFVLTRSGSDAKQPQDLSAGGKQVEANGSNHVLPGPGSDAVPPKAPSTGPMAGWVPFVGPAGSPSLLLPGPATTAPFVLKHQEKQIKGEAYYYQRADQATFTALSLQSLRARGAVKLSVLVNLVRLQLAGTRAGLERANRTIEKDGYSGRELRFESRKKINLAGKFYEVPGPRRIVYAAVVYGPAYDVTSPETDAFLDSLTVHKPTEGGSNPTSPVARSSATSADGSDAQAVLKLSGQVKLVRFGSDGSVLLGGADLIVGNKMHATWWDAKTLQERATVALPAGATAAAFDAAPDGRTFALVESNHQLHVVDLPEGKSLARLGTPVRKHGATSVRVAFAPDGKSIAAVYGGGIIHVFDGATYSERCQMKIQRGFAPYLTFSPDGKLLAVALMLDRQVLVFDAYSGAGVAALTGDGRNGVLSHAVFSAKGDTLAVGLQDHTVRFFDVATGKQYPAIKVDEGTSELAISPDSTLLATASANGSKITLWDVGTGQTRAVLNGGRNTMIGAIAFSPDGKRLAIGNIGRVQIWDLDRVSLRPVDAARNLKIGN